MPPRVWPPNFEASSPSALQDSPKRFCPEIKKKTTTPPIEGQNIQWKTIT
jgi:hypothetical protein